MRHIKNENIKGKVKNFKNALWRILENFIWKSCGSKLWLQLALNLREMVGTQRSWYLKRCPNIYFFIGKEIKFIRYIEMKISKEKWKTLKETFKKVLWWTFAFCCRSEDSSTFIENFEKKYFCKKWKYD